MKIPKFTGRNVPITEIANATGKTPQLIRVGLQKGVFHFGYAFVNNGCTEYNYYCPDKKVYEEIGYFNGDLERLSQLKNGSSIPIRRSQWLGGGVQRGAAPFGELPFFSCSAVLRKIHSVGVLNGETKLVQQYITIGYYETRQEAL